MRVCIHVCLYVRVCVLWLSIWSYVVVFGRMSDHDEKLQSIYSYVHDLPTVNYDNVK